MSHFTLKFVNNSQKSQCFHSDHITDMVPGDVVACEIASSDGGKSYSLRASSRHSSSVMEDISALKDTFNFIRTAFSINSVSSCAQMPTNDVTLGDIKVKSGGKVIASPDWYVYSTKSVCKDSITVTSPLSAVISLKNNN